MPPNPPVSAPAKFVSVNVPVSTQVEWIDGSAILRQGQVHIVTTDCYPGMPGCASRIRYLRISVAGVGPKLQATNDFDYHFGHQGPGDDPSDMVSYERPSLEVNNAGDVIFTYMRESYSTKVPLKPEARLSILYHGESANRPSMVLKVGESVPGSHPTGNGVIDLAIQSVDPSDDLTIWVTHGYANKIARYSSVIASIKP